MYVYDRGGTDRLGEITPIKTLSWNRIRDDISACTVTTAGFGPDCCDLMGRIRSMRHELVLYRDEARVWEGPVTRVAYQRDSVTIQARDGMQWVYRRILIDGYDDSYRSSLPHGYSVVFRARDIITDALSRDDPNLVPFITYYSRSDDAKQSRVVLPYQKTAWEEVDDLAANAGLDYTVVGRRITLWDTHNRVFRLPAMSDASFLDAPIVTEYGMSMATVSAVTDGLGNYGVYGGEDDYYGLVEMLASSYSSKGPPLEAKELTLLIRQQMKMKALLDRAKHAYNTYRGLTAAQETQLAAWKAERVAPGTSPSRQKELDALIAPYQARHDKKAALLTQLNTAQSNYNAAATANAKAAAKWEKYLANLRSQAYRNRQGRFPTPVAVRVPDGSQLNPALEVGINHLVPGAWIPLRSDSTCRPLTQWQKLDELNVTVDERGERVAVTLSVAPNGGVDPEDLTDELDA
jgi:hypothetical protein